MTVVLFLASGLAAGLAGYALLARLGLDDFDAWAAGRTLGLVLVAFPAWWAGVVGLSGWRAVGVVLLVALGIIGAVELARRRSGWRDVVLAEGVLVAAAVDDPAASARSPADPRPGEADGRGDPGDPAAVGRLSAARHVAGRRPAAVLLLGSAAVDLAAGRLGPAPGGRLQPHRRPGRGPHGGRAVGARPAARRRPLGGVDGGVLRRAGGNPGRLAAARSAGSVCGASTSGGRRGSTRT